MFYSRPSRTSFQPVDFYYGIPQYERRHSFIVPEFFQSREESSAENYYRRLAEEHQRKAQIALARVKQEEEIIAERQRRAANNQLQQDQARRQQEKQSYLSFAFHNSATPPVFSFSSRNIPTLSPEQRLRNEREAHLEACLRDCREKERSEEVTHGRARQQNTETEANVITEIIALLGLTGQNSDCSSHCARNKCHRQMHGKCPPPLQAAARGTSPAIRQPVKPTYHSKPAPSVPSSHTRTSSNPNAHSPSTPTSAPTQIPEHRRTSSLDSISGLQAKFNSLKATFALPDRLEFSSTDSVPKLLFSPANASVNQYENDLTKLLTKLDGVESNGDEKIREFRKKLVKTIETEFDSLDRKKTELWEASKEAGTVAKEEKVEEQPLMEPIHSASRYESVVVLSDDEDVQDGVALKQPQGGYVVSFPTSSPVAEDATSPIPLDPVTDVVNDAVEDPLNSQSTSTDIPKVSDPPIPEVRTLTSTPGTLKEEVIELDKADETNSPNINIPDVLENAGPTTTASFLATLNPIGDLNISSLHHSLTLPEIDQAAPASPTFSENSLVDVSVDDLREFAKDEEELSLVSGHEDHSDEFEML